MSESLSLLSSLNRVEVPVVKVVIGDYTFGVYQETGNKIIFPNYIKSLQVKRVNGKFNTYTLGLVYPITQADDPNFFDKVFSSVSNTRKIVISCGDAATPSFMYKNDEALITKITETIDVRNSVINYNVTAVSSAYVMTGGFYTFPAKYAKPSSVIESLLNNEREYYGLTDVFTGMRDLSLVKSLGLIPGDDKAVQLELKTNISVLDYLNYLVACMKPLSTADDSLQQGMYYSLVVEDTTSEVLKDEKNNFVFNGPYFKIMKNEKVQDAFDVYTIDIGFPSQNIVTSFEIKNDENYSILYDYVGKVNSNQYADRIDDEGKYERIYAPVLSTGNNLYKTTEADKTWWTRVTQYPIKASITLKGLLRPAILMSYVRVNMYFYGKKYAYGSGLFIITEQVDTIDVNGYRTTLSLTRVSGDEAY